MAKPGIKTAALWAPIAHSAQNWTFVPTTKKKTLKIIIGTYLITKYKKTSSMYQKSPILEILFKKNRKGLLSDIAVISKSPRAQYNSCKMT